MDDKDRILLHLRSYDAMHVSVLAKAMCQWMPATRYWFLLDTLEHKGVIRGEYNRCGVRGWVLPLDEG